MRIITDTASLYAPAKGKKPGDHLFSDFYKGVYFTEESLLMYAALLIFTIIIIYRHKKNIVKLIRHEENKITWM